MKPNTILRIHSILSTVRSPRVNAGAWVDRKPADSAKAPTTVRAVVTATPGPRTSLASSPRLGHGTRLWRSTFGWRASQECAEASCAGSPSVQSVDLDRGLVRVVFNYVVCSGKRLARRKAFLRGH